MGKSSTTKTKNTYMPGQKAGYQSLLTGAMGQLGGDYYSRLASPYAGQFTAPLTSGEKWGTDYMKNLLTQDPSTSPYYRGMRNQAYENLDRAITGTRQGANLGGMLLSSPRQYKEGQLQRQTANDLNTLLGGLYQQNIQNVLPQYMQAAGTERNIQQQDLSMRYAEFIRQMQALGIPLQTALSLATMGPTGQTTTSSSPWYAGAGDLAGALIENWGFWKK